MADPIRKTGLLVEDNEDNRVIYQVVLHRAGYQVILAENGAVGVQAARVCRPHLILMDLSMPVMDGWEAVRALKEQPDLADVPVCALSAHVPHAEDHARALEAGFATYWTKPMMPRDVLRRVMEMIGPPLGGP